MYPMYNFVLEKFNFYIIRIFTPFHKEIFIIHIFDPYNKNRFHEKVSYISRK